MIFDNYLKVHKLLLIKIKIWLKTDLLYIFI